MHSKKIGRCFNNSLLHLFNSLFIFQLPKVKTQLDKMSEVMKTDLSAIVQRVSIGHKSRDSLMLSDVSVYMSVLFFWGGCIFVVFYSQGYSSLNDTPHMVIEQTRSVVDSESCTFTNSNDSSLIMYDAL